MTIIRRLLREESGATAIEYALICALVVLAVIGAMRGLGGSSGGGWGNVANNAEAVL